MYFLIDEFPWYLDIFVYSDIFFIDFFIGFFSDLFLVSFSKNIFSIENIFDQNVFDDFFWPHISIQKITKIPKITLRKLFDETWSSIQHQIWSSPKMSSDVATKKKRSYMKPYPTKSKNLLKSWKNCKSTILKSRFLREKIIFFIQIFFPNKIWICTFDCARFYCRLLHSA